MLRKIVCALVVLVLFAGGAFAAEATVVKLEMRTKLTVKVGDKEQEIDLQGVKVTGPDGNAVPGKERRNLLKKDAKIELVEKDGKVVEIKIK
jgi:hypothetical protein